MHAIIYAAGRAVRLQALAALQNKVLIEFNGQSLLERHVALLAKINIRKVYVVTGHLRAGIQESLPLLRSRYSAELHELFNPDYTEGSVLSMLASVPALEGIAGPVFLMDGDVLYDGRMLERLVQSPSPSALLIDRDYSVVDDDPVLVPIRDGKPFEFAKRWKGEADAVGESIGLFKVDASHLSFLIRETRSRAQGLRRAESYDEIIRAMVKAGLFGAEDVTGLPWAEIDFPHDLDFASKFIAPLLRGG